MRRQDQCPWLHPRQRWAGQRSQRWDEDVPSSVHRAGVWEKQKIPIMLTEVDPVQLQAHLWLRRRRRGPALHVCPTPLESSDLPTTTTNSRGSVDCRLEPRKFENTYYTAVPGRARRSCTTIVSHKKPPEDSRPRVVSKKRHEHTQPGGRAQNVVVSHSKTAPRM